MAFKRRKTLRRNRLRKLLGGRLSPQRPRLLQNSEKSAEKDQRDLPRLFRFKMNTYKSDVCQLRTTSARLARVLIKNVIFLNDIANCRHCSGKRIDNLRKIWYRIVKADNRIGESDERRMRLNCREGFFVARRTVFGKTIGRASER